MTEHAPDFFPEDAPPPAEDLSAYDCFLDHNTYRNSIQVSGSELLTDNLLFRANEYMEELHRKAFQDIEARMFTERGYGSRRKEGAMPLARTTHYQMATILARYLPKVTAANAALGEQLKSAIAQAGKIEQRAKQLADKVASERSRGNVRFVKSIAPQVKAKRVE